MIILINFIKSFLYSEIRPPVINYFYFISKFYDFISFRSFY